MPLDPFFITIHPTAAGSCKFRCPACFSKNVEAARGTDPKAALTDRHALQISKIAGGRQLGFTGGGEPFAHKDLVHFVELTCSGKKTPEGFTIITNGAGFATPEAAKKAIRGLDRIAESKVMLGSVLLSIDPAHVDGHPKGKKEAAAALRNFLASAGSAKALQLAVKVSLPGHSEKKARDFLSVLGISKLPSNVKLLVHEWSSEPDVATTPTDHRRLPEHVVLAANGDVFLGHDYHSLRKPFDNINSTPIETVFSRLYDRFKDK